MKQTLPNGVLSIHPTIATRDDCVIFQNEFTTEYQALQYPEIAQVLNGVTNVRVEVYKDCYENGIYYGYNGKPLVILFRVWAYIGKNPKVIGIMQYVVEDDDVRPENVPYDNKIVVEGAIRLALATTKLSNLLKPKH